MTHLRGDGNATVGRMPAGCWARERRLIRVAAARAWRSCGATMRRQRDLCHAALIRVAARVCAAAAACVSVATGGSASSSSCDISPCRQAPVGGMRPRARHSRPLRSMHTLGASGQTRAGGWARGEGGGGRRWYGCGSSASSSILARSVPSACAADVPAPVCTAARCPPSPQSRPTPSSLEAASGRQPTLPKSVQSSSGSCGANRSAIRAIRTHSAHAK